MFVSGIVLTGVNAVHIDIKNLHVQQLHMSRFQPCFLGSLAQGDPQDIRVPVGMPAWLEPLVKLAVMHHQYTAAIRTHHPGGTGDVRGPVVTMKTVCVSLDKGTCPRDITRLLHETGGMIIQQLKQFLSMHG
jgi:hypothetical protein